MIQAARFPAMDASLATRRPEYADDSNGSGGKLFFIPPTPRVPAAGATPRTAECRILQQPLTSSTAEGRARKRFQRTMSENEDPLRRTGFTIPFGRQNNPPPSDPKVPQHARRRSTLRDNKAPLLGPRPLENKRWFELFWRDIRREIPVTVTDIRFVE